MFEITYPRIYLFYFFVVTVPSYPPPSSHIHLTTPLPLVRYLPHSHPATRNLLPGVSTNQLDVVKGFFERWEFSFVDGVRVGDDARGLRLTKHLRQTKHIHRAATAIHTESDTESDSESDTVSDTNSDTEGLSPVLSMRGSIPGVARELRVLLEGFQVSSGEIRCRFGY